MKVPISHFIQIIKVDLITTLQNLYQSLSKCVSRWIEMDEWDNLKKPSYKELKKEIFVSGSYKSLEKGRTEAATFLVIYIHIQTVCKARGGKRLLFVITNTILYLRCRVILAADIVELLHNKAACFLHERKA